MHRRFVRTALLLALGFSFGAPPARAYDTVKRHDVWSFKRGGARSVFDPARQRWFVLGGSGPRYESAPQMLDLLGPPVWQPVQVQGSGPGTAVGGDGVVLYDSNRNRVLCFIPKDPKVYALSLTEPFTWSSFTPDGGTITYGMSAAYDPQRDQAVFYGGYDYNDYQPAILQTHAGTRILSLSGTPGWLTPSGLGEAPTSRACAQAVWDPVGDRMILQGGFYQDSFSPTTLNDTYVFNYVAGIPVWTKLTNAGTGPRASRAQAVFDSLYQRMFVYAAGGSGNVLDLADSALWTYLPSSAASSPYRNDHSRGMTAVYDPANQRVLVFGGIGTDARRQDVALGGIDQGTLGATSQFWSRLPVAGDPDFPVLFGGYDRARHRFVGLAGTVPFTLSVDDTTWTPAGEKGTAFASRLHPFYDPGSNTLYAVAPGDLYVIQPGDAATWTHVPINGPAPASFDSLGVAFLEAARNRVLILGSIGNSAATANAEFWQLTLGPNPAWTKLADTTPLGARFTSASLDVRRDRALFFGGRNMTTGARTSDLWALDLGTLQFSQPVPSGVAPGARPEVPAAYDSTGDRLVVAGDSLAGTFDLQFGPADSNGRWIRNDPTGPSYPMPFGGMAACDPVRNRMYSADATRIFDHAFSAYTPPLVVTGPRPQMWTPASVLGMNFQLAIGVAGTHTYAWTLRSDRAWPFLPASGQKTITTPGPNFVGVNVAVPDSAAPGTNVLHFEIHDVVDVSIADSVTVLLGSPLPAWIGGSATPTLHSVAVSWKLSGAWAGIAQLERRPEGGNWNYLANVPVRPDSIIAYVDTTVVQGGLYGYRATLTGVGDMTTSGELLVTVPRLWTGGTASAVGDSVSLYWQLGVPNDGTARIERRPDAGTWITLADVPVAKDGGVSYVDRSDLSDGRYGYRAGLFDASGWNWSNEVLVEIRSTSIPPDPGPGYTLAFANAGAMIASGSPQVSFTVPAAGTVRLEMFDLKGRRLDSQSLEARQAGPYSLRLDAVFPSGIYFLKLTQGDASAKTRVVLFGGD